MNRKGAAVFLIAALFIGTVFVIGITDEEHQYFDHYKTDVTIILDGDGNALITETYKFRWNDISSGEMYVSFSDEKAKAVDTSTVRCWVDGVPASLVSYSDGARETYSGVDIALYSYGVNSISDDWEINAFYKRAKSGEHTVTLQYMLKKIVSKYDDCAELYYKVFTTFSEDLKDLTVTVTMPAGSLQEQTRIFGHGDPNGYCEFDGNNALFKSSNLAAFTMFEIRVVTLQTDLFPGVAKSSARTLDSIMAEEKKFYDDTQRDIMLANVQKILIAGMFIGGILIFIFRVRFFKRNKRTFKNPYMRELPSVKPNISGRMAKQYKLFGGNFGNSVAATILNLALMKVITIEEGKDKEIVFVSLNPGKPMTRFERSVHRMLFSSAKDGDRITLSELKKTLRASPYEHSNLYDTDEQEFEGKGYIDRELTERNQRLSKLPLAVCVLMIPVIIISIVIDFSDYIPIGMFAVFFNFGLMIICTIKGMHTLTAEGEDERARTLALKRFYTDMTLMKERQTMELALWEEHLVYATALGVADRVIRELNIRIMQLDPNAVPAYNYIFVLHNAGGLSENISGISKVSNAAFIRSSSGRSGGGGGFSGGGGGGFTGGGGGGFGGGGGGHR